jgi:hypothetical protein
MRLRVKQPFTVILRDVPARRLHNLTRSKPDEGSQGTAARLTTPSMIFQERRLLVIIFLRDQPFRTSQYWLGN